ncbi:MAG: tripartite tricarboxylate transporter TctB family protein [Bradyrhizobiaceae bacterium]|nr:MAG: tripartite tricarboxylate transporter TctB family protein [Bradyrhizobiaceae bacterium]
MSEAPDRAANPSNNPSITANQGRIKGPQDFYGGLVLMGVALFALWASSDLPGSQGFAFGAGTAPRMFGVLLLILGAGIAVSGYFIEGEPLQRYGVRGPLFVTAAILFFALTIRSMGLVVTGFISFMIAAYASHETRFVQAAIVGACLTIGCALLFPYALGLPLELFPRFLLR